MEQLMDNEQERIEKERVIKAFFRDGRLIQIPAKMKKRIIAYKIILDKFEYDRDYPESEVNEIIGSICEDFCTVRRAFVDAGWMTSDFTSATFANKENNSRLSMKSFAFLSSPLISNVKIDPPPFGKYFLYNSYAKLNN